MRLEAQLKEARAESAKAEAESASLGVINRELAAGVAKAQHDRAEAEVRIAEAQRERVLADLDLARAIKAREREAATESTRAAERKALAKRRTALRVAAGLTVAWFAVVLACAGVWGAS